MDARQIALLTLSEWESGDRKIDAVLERELRTATLDDRDVALAQNLTYGVIRWKGRLDWVLDQYVKGGLLALPITIRNALRLGLYQIDYLDRIPPRAAVSESVNLAKRYGHRGTAGLTNAVLRNILTSLRPDFPTMEEDPVAHISVVYSHPPVLIGRWLDRYGPVNTTILCEYNNQVPRLVARVNRLRTDAADLAKSLRRDGRDSRPGRYFDDCIEILGGGDVKDLTAFRNGEMQFQDESTLAAVTLLNPEPGETVVDMCAAPGGKTTAIADRMRGHGTIKAFEISDKRADMLRENIERLGLDNCEVIEGEATSETAGGADAVLVDAPCTGTGTLGRRVDARWKFDIHARERIREDIEELERIHPRQIFARQTSRQLRLLHTAAKLVRPGGRIVYSTCSLEPEENTYVVKRFLEKRNDFTVENAARFCPDMFVDGGYVSILPHRHGIDGAFAARLVRKGGTGDDVMYEEEPLPNEATMELSVEGVLSSEEVTA
ncbi:MAG: 16S rRNA (cytosine(967)-C(5))-methyltransferase RsmB [Candidatus Eisenbacteria bacterium]|nr:16S rRNA (cytosine(967)-C(5))-methyltransferase RsmB [Candidatus Eisenbacteria bacterium]